VDIPDKVLWRTQKCFKGWVAIAATENVAVWRDDHFDHSRRSPVFIKQASENSLEVIADTSNGVTDSPLIRNSLVSLI